MTVRNAHKAIRLGRAELFPDKFACLMNFVMGYNPLWNYAGNTGFIDLGVQNGCSSTRRSYDIPYSFGSIDDELFDFYDFSYTMLDKVIPMLPYVGGYEFQACVGHLLKEWGHDIKWLSNCGIFEKYAFIVRLFDLVDNSGTCEYGMSDKIKREILADIMCDYLRHDVMDFFDASIGDDLSGRMKDFGKNVTEFIDHFPGVFDELDWEYYSNYEEDETTQEMLD